MRHPGPNGEVVRVRNIVVIIPVAFHIVFGILVREEDSWADVTQFPVSGGGAAVVFA